MVDYDLVIIGSGPAGMNACLYASRAGLKTIVIEKNYPGGKIVKANEISNYLGFEKINGGDLALNMFKHSFSFGAKYMQGNVIDIVNYEDNKKVILDNKEITCYAIVLAIGTNERKLQIKGEDKFYGKGVSYCVTCDALLYKNKDIACIINEEKELNNLDYLLKFVKKIYLYSDNKNLIEQVKNNEKIEIIKEKIISINGKENVESITLNNNEIIMIEGIFPLLGNEPNNLLIKKLNLKSKNDYIVVNEKQETSIEGVFAAGDCTNNNLKQIVTATSSGSVAALEANNYIKKIKNHLR